MKRIDDELCRVKELNNQVGHDFLVSNKFKDYREWWILCHMALHLEKQGLQSPVFAEKTNPPEPDFITYSNETQRFKPVKVTEVLTPGRKRGDEYRNNEQKPYSLEFIKQSKEPWSSFIDILKKKSLKRYDNITDCWLLIYHNMRFCEITNAGFWHSVILSVAKKWYEVNNQYSFNIMNSFMNSPYEKILVLNSDACAMVEIYPSCSVITPE